jgi:hypothetical protein
VQIKILRENIMMMRTEKFSRDYQVKTRFIEAESIYLLNRLKITTEKLNLILPLLEQKIDKESNSFFEFNSFTLFLKLCFKHQDKLPNDFDKFKNPFFLKEQFLTLRQVKLFNKQTTKNEKIFVENAIRNLVPVDKLAKKVSLEMLEDAKKNIKKDPEEKHETFSSTEKDLLIFFCKASDKSTLLTDKISEKDQDELVKRTTEKSHALLDSPSTVFGKKRKLNEVETADQNLIKTKQSLGQLDDSTIPSSKILSLVSR